MADPVFAERYRAMSSRDARFDGQFITGVHTTGIYCRPSCPAATPRPGNVTFYLTSAAAHEAGLRACKRCLPDAVPGSPDWNTRDDLAARAMRLIDDGTVERDGVPGLARRLGYTPRHLTRVLVAELGAGPLALARAHRAQTARLLLLGTALPISEVAFAAGFGSVRQFNDTIAAVYERTPGELRRSARATRAGGPAGDTRAAARGATDAGRSATARTAPAARDRRPEPAGPRVAAPAPGAGLPSALRPPLLVSDRADAAGRAPGEPAVLAGPGTGIRLLLPARAPFDGAGVLAFLGTRAIPGVELAGPGTYARTLRLPHGSATVELSLAGTADAPQLACTARLGSLDDLAPLVSRVRRLLDLDADAQAIDRALSADPLLAGAVRAAPGIRLPGSMDPEETLFRALFGQQVSVASARTALTRLCAELGEALPLALPATATPPATETLPARAPASASGAEPAPGLDRLFPTAERIAADGHRVLRGPARRIAAILGVAEALATGELALSTADSRESLTGKLTALPGIGPWTAGYVAMRVLGSPDILLTSDLALRQGAARLGLPADPRALAAHGGSWAPWRSYAGMHLWRAAGLPGPAAA
nr:AlkA N-terminal domain-containing protein [Cryobacterium zhongshanensis]